MNIRATARRAAAAVALSLALAGLGSGMADAKPMERDHAKYCAKIWHDYDFTAKAFKNAYDKWGPNDVLTLQAASNYERAYNKLTGSGC